MIGTPGTPLRKSDYSRALYHNRTLQILVKKVTSLVIMCHRDVSGCVALRNLLLNLVEKLFANKAEFCHYLWIN